MKASTPLLGLALAMLLVLLVPRCWLTSRCNSTPSPLSSEKQAAAAVACKSTAAASSSSSSPHKPMYMPASSCVPCSASSARRYPGDPAFAFAMQPGSSSSSYAKWTSQQWETELLRMMKANVMDDDDGGRFTIVSTANMGHWEFTLNWVASLKRNSIDKFVVICFDLKLFDLLVRHGLRQNAVLVPKHWIPSRIQSYELRWQSKGYNALTVAKLHVQNQLLSRGFAFVFSDVDVVFLSPHVVRHVLLAFDNGEQPGATPSSTDMVFMYDQDTDINTGFFAVLPTEMMLRAFNSTIGSIAEWAVDQIAFNYEVRSVLKIKYSRHLKGLDKSLYVNGWGLVQEKLNERFGIPPLVAHVNYAEGKAQKVRMLAGMGYWYL